MAMQKLTLQELEIEKPKVLPSEFLRIGWIQGDLAATSLDVEKIDKEESEIDPNSNDAVGWCALGAFCAALDIQSEYSFGRYEQFMSLLRRMDLFVDLGFADSDLIVYDVNITEFNDEQARDVADVLEIVESIELHLGWR